MKRVIILIIMVMLVCSCSSQQKNTIKNVSCDEMINLQEDGAVLIDVRTEEEFNSNHLDGAINIDHQEIKDKIADEVSDKSKKIIVYCQSGNRSAQAGKILIDLGYENVYDLGGISNCD